jgi:hypothetical protein
MSYGFPNALASPTCLGDTIPNQPFPTAPIQPVKDTVPATIYRLNRSGLRYDLSAIPVKTPSLGPACRTGWVFQNPITYDAPRGIQTVFDAPPLTGAVNVGNTCHDEIYTPYFGRYGTKYRNYLDMNAGQITYYLDENTCRPFTSPVFTTPARVRGRLFVDPMGQVKPEYSRVPRVEYAWNCPYADACDSATHDTLEFRQDLIARQQRKNDQQRWEYRWGETVVAQSAP